MAARNVIGASNQDAYASPAPLALWTLAWIATLALARFGPAHLRDEQQVASWAAIAVNIAIGAGLIAVHARFLKKLDELQRKIMVDAMAFTLGATLVGGCAYGAATASGLIDGDASIGNLVILMGVVYVIAIIAGHVRYR